MKKYLFTALLWVFALFGAFASADSVDWFNSSSSICSESFSNSEWEGYYSDCGVVNMDSYYACINVSENFIPLQWFYSNWTAWVIDSSNYCFSSSLEWGDKSFTFDSDSEVSWTIYISSSPITYNSSSDSWNWGLVENWTWTFSWIITSLWTTISEFIPYVVYLWVWILGALIWFVAVKRLMNRIRRKVLWTFSNWRRR